MDKKFIVESENFENGFRIIVKKPVLSETECMDSGTRIATKIMNILTNPNCNCVSDK